MTSVVEAINSAAGGWWTFVVHATWQSSLLAAILLAVVRLGRRWPAQIRYALVVIALMKFAVPPTLSLPTGLFSHLGPVVVQDGGRAAPDDPKDPDHAPGENGGGPWAAVTHSLGTVGWQSWLMLLHVAGCLATVAYLAAQWGKVSAVARRAKAFTHGPLCRHVAGLCSRMRLRRPVRLLVAAEPVSPMAFGVLRPTVLVPASLFRDVPPDQMDTILAHELAHHQRGDILVNWCQAALSTLWWFNPVVWMLNRAVRRAREDCCDDLLLARKLTTDGTYCRALLHVATGLRRSLLAAAVSGFAQRVHPLGDRIRRIMDPRLHRAEKLSFVTVTLMLGIAGLVLPGLRSGPGPSRQTAGSSLSAAGGAHGGELPSVGNAWTASGNGAFGIAAAGARRTPGVPRPIRAGTYLWYLDWPRPRTLGRHPENLAEPAGPSEWPFGVTGCGELRDSARPEGSLPDVYADMDPAGLQPPTATVFILDMDIVREVRPEVGPPEDARPFELPAEHPAPPAFDWNAAEMRFASCDGDPAERGGDYVTIIEVAEKAAPPSVPPKLDMPAGPPAPKGLWEVVADFAPIAEDPRSPVWDSAGPIVITDVPDLADAEQPDLPALDEPDDAPAYSGYLAKLYEQYPELVGLLDDIPPEAFRPGFELMPEPAGLVMLAVGAAVLLRRRRRRA